MQLDVNNSINGISSINGEQIGGFHNLLLNARGLINQRSYTSGAATSSANQYTVDRWRVVTSGQSVSWTDSAGIRTFTAPAGGFEQVVSGENIESGTHVINWEGTATCEIDGVSKSKGDTVTLTNGVDCKVTLQDILFQKKQELLEPF